MKPMPKPMPMPKAPLRGPDGNGSSAANPCSPAAAAAAAPRGAGAGAAKRTAAGTPARCWPSTLRTAKPTAAGTRRPRLTLAAAAAGAALGALALLAGMPAARAADPWYQVEVVIFGQGGDAAWEEGRWRPADGPPPVTENTVELLDGLGGLAGEGSNASRRRHAFRRLPESALELRQTVSRLERSDEYRVVLHTAWRQPGAGGGRAPGVRLSTLRGAAADGRFARGSGAAAAAVEGTIRLRRQRSVYVDADLAFGSLEARPASAGEETADGAAARDEGASGDGEGRSPGGRAEDDPAPPARAAPPDPGQAAAAAREDAAPGGEEAGPPHAGREGRPTAARLTRTLRVAPGRLQYIDHPLFGVLLLVRRLP